MKTTRPSTPSPPPVIIEHCTFNGVNWDAPAVKMAQTIADGLQANAEALGKLVGVLHASHVTIESMLKVGADGPVGKP